MLYSSSAHECAIGEVSARTEGLKTPSYQSVYTGHLTPSPEGHSPYTAARHRGIVQLCNDAVGIAQMQNPTLHTHFHSKVNEYIIHTDTNRIMQLIVSILT